MRKLKNKHCNIYTWYNASLTDYSEPTLADRHAAPGHIQARINGQAATGNVQITGQAHTVCLNMFECIEGNIEWLI